MQGQYRRQGQPSYSDRKIRCNTCNALVPEPNFLTHQARCSLMASRYVPNQEVRRQSPESYPQSSSRRAVPVRPSMNSIAQENEKIPCPFCGYMQTMAQLDTHPNQCQHRQQQCELCHGKFPRSLMAEHTTICQRNHFNVNRRPNVHPSHQIGYQDYEQDEQQHQYHRNNPFSNFDFLFRNQHRSPPRRQQAYQRRINQQGQFDQNQRRRGPFFNNSPERRLSPGFNYSPQRRQSPGFNYNHPQRRQSPGFINNHQGQGIVVIDTTDQFGNVRRVVMPQSRFAQSGGDPRGGMLNFFRLLQMLAGHRRQQNKGLTRQQLDGLQRISYKPGPTEAEKDLCTICYCQFQEGQKVVNLRCKHLYHEECILKWLQSNHKCPVCKRSQTDRHIEEQA